MQQRTVLILMSALLCSCANEQATPWDPAAGLEVVDNATVLKAPPPRAGTYAPELRGLIERGRYMVEILGCGSCHTDGALDGEPHPDRALAGSAIGIAYTNPLRNDKPGVVYPPNLTPDEETGIGAWSDQQIANAICAGIGGHNSRPIAMMPWQGYSRMREDDVDAIVSYLRSIEPVEHRVPAEVPPGQTAQYPFVYFGVYRNRE